MSRVTSHMSMSLDGFVAGPDQSLDDPLGRDGMRLHEWHLRVDEPGFEAGIPARDELLRPMGAYVMGRNMFGPIRGPWAADWRGWWGDEPPYHAPVFVLTHHPREPIEMQGGTTFHFVGEGFDAALAQARAVAGDREVAVAGGASTVRQALARADRDAGRNDVPLRWRRLRRGARAGTCGRRRSGGRGRRRCLDGSPGTRRGRDRRADARHRSRPPARRRAPFRWRQGPWLRADR